MTQRVVVVGGDAAGMSAAHQALRAAERTGRSLEVVALEATDVTSYSACGLPYWVGGEVPGGGAALVARTPEQHREAGIDLRLGVSATRIDPDARKVETDAGETLEYDDVVVATGSASIVPDWALVDGRLAPDVGPVKTIADGQAWLDRLGGEPRDVLVVGGGYVGIEMAEAAARRGHRVRVETRSRVMSRLEPEFSERVADGMRAAGVRVAEGTTADGLEPGTATVLALGVEPRTAMLPDSVERGPSGGLRPDPTGRVADGLWSAGDCAEVHHRVLDDWTYLPLATHANKHGRVLGDHLGSGGDSRLSFDGALGTAITRFAAGPTYLEVATTGVRADQVEGAVSLTSEGATMVGYLEESEEMAVNVVADPVSRRLLGVEIVGGRGAGKRIDAAAAVLWHGGTVDDLAWMDLSYAPPFATTWEFLQIAARRLAERL